MKTLLKTLVVTAGSILLVVVMISAILVVAFITSPTVNTIVSDCLVEKVDPELLCWAEDFQNQFALIVSGSEKERLESRMKYLTERELTLEKKLSVEGNQTPWQKLVHGDTEKGLNFVKSQKSRLKYKLFWTRIKDKLKFW